MIDGNGILLPENPKPEAVSDAINRLCDMSDDEMKKMRERSRELWEQKYNAEENAENFVRTLREIN